MRRLGQRRSSFPSPVASLIVLAALVFALEAGASESPRGLEDLAGPLRAIALGTAGNAGSDAAVKASSSVTVEIRFRSRAEAFGTDLGKYGAQVQFRRDERAQARVPADRLLEIAALPQVAQVSEPAPVVTCQGFGGVVSEAVQFTNASAMQNSGFTGAGASIAIIDIGFANLAAAEVPATAQVVSLRADGSTTASQHGTAMAEVVADMAPDADLTLVAVDTPMSIEAAADFVAVRDFQIAVMGLAVVDGPFDGTHSLTRAVNSAASGGVLWIQAAGNMAQRHWAGAYSDADADGIHEFDTNTEGISLALTAGTFQAYLSWYETAGPATSQDYDLVLVDAQDAIVAQSSLTQNGDDPPREFLRAAVATATYKLQIRRIAGNPLQADAFQLYIPDYDITPAALQVPESSLPVPAEAPNVLTIGATRGTTIDPTPYNLAAVGVDVIEPFSSQGPALSGVRKPELVAPDATRTSLAAVGAAPITAGGEFIAPNAFGTSFAAAHVAGAAALLLSEDTTRGKAELQGALVRLAVAVPPPPPTNPPLPNDIYGNGRLNLRVGTDVAKPVAIITYPRSGETISTTEPVITGYVSDTGSGIKPGTIVLTLDGEVLNVQNFDPQTGIFSFRVGPPAHAPLSRSSHRITLDVSDYDGNAAVQAVSTFRVSPPMIDGGLHMISLPYADLADMRPSAIFGLPAEQVLVVRWLPTDSTIGDKYHWWGGPTGVEDQYASFEPLDSKEPPFVVSDPPAGLGYFLSVPTSAILNVSGRSLADETSYDIHLSAGTSRPRGWNMIGCPFPDTVTWGGVEFITNGQRQDLREAIDSGVTEGVLFALKRAGNSFYYDFPADPLSGSIKPFQGYWLHVLKDTTLRVYNSVVTAGTEAAPKAQKAEAPSEAKWTLKFGASVNGAQDPVNYLGVAPAASDGYDAGGDVPEPPALSSAVRVYLAHEDWGASSGQYAKDIRGAVGLGQEWDVVVECAEAGQDVTLNWADLNSQVPAGVSLTLSDEDAGRDVFMRTVAGYTYRSAGENSKRHFRITATPAGDGGLSMTNVTAQQAPDGTVQLSYTVNRAATVSAEVLNIAGRSISELGTRVAAPGGVETLAWNARNRYGAKVPGGRYMIRLAARAEDGQVAHSVRTFHIGR